MYRITSKAWPIIQGDSTEINLCTSFDVIIDEIAVSSSNNLMTAVTVFLASFYVLNLAYPTCLKKTLSFFQKIVLNIQDNISSRTKCFISVREAK